MPSAHERSADDRACLVQRHTRYTTYITQTEAYKGLNKAWLTARTTMAWLWFVGPCRAAVVTAVHRTRKEHATGCTSRLAGGAAPIVQSVCALWQWPCSATAAQGLRHVIPPQSERECAWRRLPLGRASRSKRAREELCVSPCRRRGSRRTVCVPCGSGPAAQGLHHVIRPPPKRARWRVGRTSRCGSRRLGIVLVSIRTVPTQPRSRSVTAPTGRCYGPVNPGVLSNTRVGRGLTR